jgi:hypothetical protein
VHPQAQAGQQGVQPPRQAPWPQQPAQQGYPAGFAQQPEYGQQPAQQQPYGQWSELQPGHQSDPYAAQADPYAPQFEPYVPPTNPSFGRQPAPGFAQQQPAPQQPASQWPGRAGADPRGFDVGAYAAPGFQPQPGQPGRQGFAETGYEPELSAADWAGEPGGFGHDPYQHAQAGGDLGFAQAEGGELDQAYAEDDGEYEDDEPPRGRRPMMIAMALVGAILVGGGVAYGYKKLTSGGSQGDPPIIKSEAFPSKTKPADAGGKTFPYSDSKIMGRLGDGTSPAPAPDAGNDSAAPDAAASNPAADDSADDGGPRKVATLVVGRDGSIQPPPGTSDSAPPASPTQNSSSVAVPGTALVDVFGQGGNASAKAQPGRDEPLPDQRANSRSVSGDDTPAPMKKASVKPVTIAKADSGASAKSAATGSIGDEAPAPAKKKLKRVARAETTASDANTEAPPPVTSSSGAAGFVAVLASVPRSSSSRMDALKRFADMQQKYGTALSGKTPDVASANLGSKGNYDRLIVGPPGSRAEASNVCTQLKAQGYTSCWVTGY